MTFDSIAELEKLKEKQVQQSDKVSAQAADVSQTAISNPTVYAAARALDRVLADSGKGALGESASDFNDLKSDAALVSLINKDVRMAEKTTYTLIAGALALGYKTQVEGTPMQGAQLKVSFDSVSNEYLASYPILGQTAEDHASELANRLRIEIWKKLGQSVVGQIPPDEIHQAMFTVANDHAKRVGSLVAETYYAGAQAGTKDAANALTGNA